MYAGSSARAYYISAGILDVFEITSNIHYNIFHRPVTSPLWNHVVVLESLASSLESSEHSMTLLAVSTWSALLTCIELPGVAFELL